MSEPLDYTKHPAAEGFSRPVEMMKHVAGKAMKWAAYGAMIFGALYLLPALLGGAGAGLISTITFGLIQPVAGKVALTVLANGLLWGGVAGAIFGGLKGVAGAGEAVEEKLQDRIAEWEGNEVANERRQAMALQRQQVASQASVQAPVISPNIGLSAKQGQGAGLG